MKCSYQRMNLLHFAGKADLQDEVVMDLMSQENLKLFIK